MIVNQFDPVGSSLWNLNIHRAMSRALLRSASMHSLELMRLVGLWHSHSEQQPKVVIESGDSDSDGLDALTDITAANYSTLTSFNTEAYSPSVPGSGGSLEMGNYTASISNVTVITYYYSLLCIIQDTLNNP